MIGFILAFLVPARADANLDREPGVADRGPVWVDETTPVAVEEPIVVIAVRYRPERQ